MMKMKNSIKIFGAKIHNLKNISVEIPKNKLVVICGVSGSGKSSLAFDTIYQEGQRRYLESLSSYARQFLGGLKKPKVDKIVNLSPTLAISQRTISSNPRSIVGTITEIYDYLRLLFARCGKPYCPNCNIPVSSQTPEEIAKRIFAYPEGSEILILGPAIVRKKGAHQGTIEEIYRMGYSQVRIDKILCSVLEARELNLDKNKEHSIEVVTGRIDLPRIIKRSFSSKTEREAQRRKIKLQRRFKKEQKIDCLDYIKKALKIGNGTLFASTVSGDLVFSELFACPKCGFSLPKIEPRLFSFNSPYGACPQCQGLGKKSEVEPNLILNYNLSLNEGAILIWDRLSRFSRRAIGVPWQKWHLEELSKKIGFSLGEPLKNLSSKTINTLLYGDSEFEGITHRLERTYLETESDYIRKEIARYMVEKSCPLCQGSRLKKEALAVKIKGKSIYELVSLTIKDLKDFLKNLESKTKSQQRKIIQPICKEIIRRLEFLEDVGVDYITLLREAGTLSVGENQRIRLACQLGSGLSGIIYILDEPTIGLHQRDIKRLVKSLKKLRDLQNTVIIVEHDLSVLNEADWIIEIGPRAGKKGGKVVFEGTFSSLKKASTLTAKYISGKLKVNSGFPKKIVEEAPLLEIFGASCFNLKNINLKIPLGRLVGVAGVSGSGKSTLIIETLSKALLKKFYQTKVFPGAYQKLSGAENLNRVILVDQSPIGRTPRSNPATYVGFFGEIREIFAKVSEARLRGYTASHFSFNTKAGRCSKCRGEGFRKIEMYFLPDIYVECEVCKGKRFAPEILDIAWHHKNIAEVLEMSVDEAVKFFYEIESVNNRLKVLKDIGLGYIQLGQAAPSLSGGEAQRIKLAKELSSKIREKTLYILDEPTVGLHFDDIRKLLIILRQLIAKGNSVIVIEHNPDVLRECDWLIELGPEGGDEGGRIVFEGIPESIKSASTWTSKFL